MKNAALTKPLGFCLETCSSSQAWKNLFPSLDSLQNLWVSPGYNVAPPCLYKLGKKGFVGEVARPRFIWCF